MAIKKTKFRIIPNTTDGNFDIKIPLKTDQVYYDNNTIVGKLSNSTDPNLSKTISINEDENTILDYSVETSSLSVTEGSSGINVSVDIENLVGNPPTRQITLSTNGSDDVIIPSQLGLTGNTQSFEILATDDSSLEDDENYSVTLTDTNGKFNVDSAGYLEDQGVINITVQDNDVVSYSLSSDFDLVNENGGQVVFSIASNVRKTVDPIPFTISESAGVDNIASVTGIDVFWNSSNNSGTFIPSFFDGSSTITVTLQSDNKIKESNSFTFESSEAGISKTIQIVEEDEIQYDVTATPLTISEGSPAVTVDISASNALNFSSDRTLSIACDSDQVILSSNSLTIPAGTYDPSGTIASASFTITPVDDNFNEDDQNITITITDSESSNFIVNGSAGNTVEINLLDNDVLLYSLSSDFDSVDENAGQVVFSITSNVRDGRTVSFSITETSGVDNIASVTGTDVTWDPAYKTGTFIPSSSDGSASITVITKLDGYIKEDNSFIFSFLGYSKSININELDTINYDVTATPLIISEGSPAVTVDISASNVLNFSSDRTLSIVCDSDQVTLSSNSVTIPAGTYDPSGTIAIASFTITPVDDSFVELDETVTLTITDSESSDFTANSVSSDSVGTCSFEVNLLDNDEPVYNITSDVNSVDENGGEVTFKVTSNVRDGRSVPFSIIETAGVDNIASIEGYQSDIPSPYSRYRIFMTRSHSTSLTSMFLREVELINDSNQNVLREGGYYSSYAYSSKGSGATANGPHDGNVSTNWHNDYWYMTGDSYGNGHWYEWRLNSPVTILTLRNYGGTNMRDWKFQGSNDGVTWEDIADFTDYPFRTNDDGWDEISLESFGTLAQLSNPGTFNPSSTSGNFYIKVAMQSDSVYYNNNSFKLSILENEKVIEINEDPNTELQYSVSSSSLQTTEGGTAIDLTVSVDNMVGSSESTIRTIDLSTNGSDDVTLISPLNITSPSQTFSGVISTNNDNLFENDEPHIVSLTDQYGSFDLNSFGSYVSDSVDLSITVLDNDVPEYTLSSTTSNGDATVNEDGGTVTFDISSNVRKTVDPVDFYIQENSSNGLSADNILSVEGLSGTVITWDSSNNSGTFIPSSSDGSASIKVTMKTDSVYYNNNSFTFGSTGASLSETIDIVEDPNFELNYSVITSSLLIEEEGSTAINVTVNVDMSNINNGNPPLRTVSISTAGSADITIPSDLSIASSSQSFDIIAINDNLLEDSESHIVILEDSFGSFELNNSGLPSSDSLDIPVTVQDNDVASYSISSDSETVNENGEQVTITISSNVRKSVDPIPFTISEDDVVFNGTTVYADNIQSISVNDGQLIWDTSSSYDSGTFIPNATNGIFQITITTKPQSDYFWSGRKITFNSPSVNISKEISISPWQDTPLQYQIIPDTTYISGNQEFQVNEGGTLNVDIQINNVIGDYLPSPNRVLSFNYDNYPETPLNDKFPLDISGPSSINVDSKNISFSMNIEDDSALEYDFIGYVDIQSSNSNSSFSLDSNPTFGSINVSQTTGSCSIKLKVLDDGNDIVVYKITEISSLSQTESGSVTYIYLDIASAITDNRSIDISIPEIFISSGVYTDNVKTVTGRDGTSVNWNTSTNTGNFSLKNDGTANITLEMELDNIYELSKTFYLTFSDSGALFERYTSGGSFISSATNSIDLPINYNEGMDLQDTNGSNWSYADGTLKTFVTEGESVTLKVINAPKNTNLSYQISGDTGSLSSTSGSVTTNSIGYAEFTINTSVSQGNRGNDQNFRVRFPGYPDPSNSSLDVYWDIKLLKYTTVTVSSSSYEINEGDSVTITVDNLDSNTSYSYQISNPSGRTDFNVPLSGTVTSNSLGVVTFNIQTILDEVLESTDTFRFYIYNIPPSSSTGDTGNISVLNVKTFLLTASYSGVGTEGDQVTLTLTGANGLSNVPVYVRRKDDRGNLINYSTRFSYAVTDATGPSGFTATHGYVQNTPIYPYQIGTISDDGQLQWTIDKSRHQLNGSSNGTYSTYICPYIGQYDIYEQFSNTKTKMEFYLQGHPADSIYSNPSTRGVDWAEIDVYHKYYKNIHLIGAGTTNYLTTTWVNTGSSSGTTYYKISQSHNYYCSVQFAVMSSNTGSQDKYRKWYNEENRYTEHSLNPSWDSLYNECARNFSKQFQIRVQKYSSITGSPQSITASDFSRTESGYTYYGTQIDSTTVSLGTVSNSLFELDPVYDGNTKLYDKFEVDFPNGNLYGTFYKFYLVPLHTTSANDVSNQYDASHEYFWVRIQ